LTTRDLTAAMLSAIAAGTVRPVIFYEGEFAAAGSPTTTQFVRLFTGIGSISWDGKTWTGGGQLLGISPIEETTEIRAVGFSVTISGLPTDKITLAMTLLRQGLPGKIWLGLFDASGDLIADPYQARRGKLDMVVVELGPEACTVALQYEDRLIDLETPRGRRYTSEDQQIDYPNDLGFDFVPSLQDLNLTWE